MTVHSLHIHQWKYKEELALASLTNSPITDILPKLKVEFLCDDGL